MDAAIFFNHSLEGAKFKTTEAGLFETMAPSSLRLRSLSIVMKPPRDGERLRKACATVKSTLGILLNIQKLVWRAK